jgi:hypothetical protein
MSMPGETDFVAESTANVQATSMESYYAPGSTTPQSRLQLRVGSDVAYLKPEEVSALSDVFNEFLAANI